MPDRPDLTPGERRSAYAMICIAIAIVALVALVLEAAWTRDEMRHTRRLVEERVPPCR